MSLLLCVCNVQLPTGNIDICKFEENLFSLITLRRILSQFSSFFFFFFFFFSFLVVAFYSFIVFYDLTNSQETFLKGRLNLSLRVYRRSETNWSTSIPTIVIHTCLTLRKFILPFCVRIDLTLAKSFVNYIYKNILVKMANNGGDGWGWDDTEVSFDTGDDGDSQAAPQGGFAPPFDSHAAPTQAPPPTQQRGYPPPQPQFGLPQQHIPPPQQQYSAPPPHSQAPQYHQHPSQFQQGPPTQQHQVPPQPQYAQPAPQYPHQNPHFPPAPANQHATPQYSNSVHGGVPPPQQQFGPGGHDFNNMIGNLSGNPLAQIAGSVAEQNYNVGKAYVEQNLNKYSVSYAHLRYFFDLDTGYVLRKLLLLLFPFMPRNWSRKVVQEQELPPRADCNAPDLYIPLMSFVTYILVVAFVMGTKNEFSPDVLGMTASSGVVGIVVEVMIFKLLLHLLAVQTSRKSFTIVEVVAICSYIFVGLFVNILIGLFFGEYGYYFSWVYNSICMAKVVVESFRSILVPGPHANYFLAFAGLMQFVMSFCLGISP